MIAKGSPASAPTTTQTRCPTLSPKVMCDTGRVPYPSRPISQVLHQEELNRVAGSEVMGHFLGPMPIQEFLDNFLPPCSKPSRSSFKYSPSTSRRATRAQFLSALSAVCPSLISLGDDNTFDPVSGASPGIALYQKSPGNANGGCNFARMELFGEICLKASEDPFSDRGGDDQYPFEPRHGRNLRGQLTSSAAAIMGQQFRCHLFAFIITGKYARVLRWDKAGIIVTERFEYATTDALVEFFWRFGNASDAVRGRDPSLQEIESEWPTDIASPEVLNQLKLADDYHYDTPDYVRSVRRHQYFALIKVPDRFDASLEKDVLISCPPAYQINSPLGRSTRPMLAYDPAQGHVVFFKQYWRNGEPGSRKEGDVYHLLEQAKVRNLPAFSVGNDVRDISTVSHKFQSLRSWAYRTAAFAMYRLYRMTLNTIGEPLTQFANPKELLTAVTDAMICHDDAFFRAKILHCDISVGNIMIHPQTRRGMLIDWDLCANVKPGSLESAADNRTGTWEFMSASLLRDPKRPQSLLDDRESLIYVLFWVLLLYSPHDNMESLPVWFEMFIECAPLAGASVGGVGKRRFLLGTDLTKDIVFSKSGPLPDLLTALQDYFSYRYVNKWYAPPMPVDVMLSKLGEEGWLVGILQKALDDGPWSSDDAPSIPNECSRTPSRKRKAFQAELDVEERFSKLRKLAENDYAYVRSLPRDMTKVPPLPPDAPVVVIIARRRGPRQYL